MIPALSIGCARLGGAGHSAEGPTQGIAVPPATHVRKETASVEVAERWSLDSACPGAATLEALGDCIESRMQGPDFAQFREPDPAFQSAWRGVVASMLSGECDSGLLTAAVTPAYAVTTFLDSDNRAEYCVLMEILDADQDRKADGGWGTFIVSRSHRRQIGIQVPHPVDEGGTLQQGFRIFKQTGARYLLVAGTHRNAGKAGSACQAGFDRADVTHNVDNLFQSTVEEMARLVAPSGAELVHLQLHGMARDSCRGVDVLLSYGVTGLPDGDEVLLALQARLEAENPTWVVEVSGDSPVCELEGTLNVQGRLLNGVPADSVCAVPARRATGLFVHVEQTAAARDAAGWVDAINATFPEPAK